MADDIQPVHSGSFYLSIGDWLGGTVATNPTINQILDDTGALTAGKYLFGVIAGGSVEFVVDLEHRDAGNSTNVNVARIYVPAKVTIVIPLPNDVTLAEGERVRARLTASITGDASVAIFKKRVR